MAYDRKTQMWTGQFQRGSFSGHVILRRPASAPETKPSPFVGTWSSGGLEANGCVHILQGANGELIGWSDDIQLTGLFRYAKGLKPPEYTIEQYGILAGVEQVNRYTVSIEFQADTPMCCSHTFFGAISYDGSTLAVRWPEGVNQAPRNASWKKMLHDSCIR